MKTSELIELLKTIDPDGNMDVGFEYDYHDHWHTTVVDKAVAAVKTEIKFSDYHEMYVTVPTDERDEFNEKMVVLIA